MIAVNIDQGHPGYPGHLLRDYMAEGGHEFRMIAEDTYSIVTELVPAGKTQCSLCSRLRRGILYSLARELGCTKIALGHHRDDAITTLDAEPGLRGAAQGDAAEARRGRRRRTW